MKMEVNGFPFSDVEDARCCIESSLQRFGHVMLEAIIYPVDDIFALEALSEKNWKQYSPLLDTATTLRLRWHSGEDWFVIFEKVLPDFWRYRACVNGAATALADQIRRLRYDVKVAARLMEE